MATPAATNPATATPAATGMASTSAAPTSTATTGTATGAIDVQNIVKTFGDFTAVKGITFDVKPGEVIGLLGPNGAGKSTLIRMMTTLLPPVSRVNVWEMLRKVKDQRDLTVLITTHSMDEADKLCDRIAIVDHGELKALDSPLKLKASIPGKNALEVSFSSVPAGWQETLRGLPDVESVESEDHVFRIASRSGPATTSALIDAAARQQINVLSLAVQSTTLDDVFVHYTGRALRDALQEPSPADRNPMLRRN